MEENNGMKENQYAFGNTDNTGNDYENKVSSRLDENTFGNETNLQEDQKTTVYTPEWNANTDVYTSQAQYNAQTAVPVQEKKQGKALEICALIFGIISLCGCCFGLFGIVGLVLGIVAIATGRKSGLSIAGLILSILGILIALMWGIFNFSSAGEQWREGLVRSYMQSFREGGSTYDDEVTEPTTGEQEKTEIAKEEQQETEANTDVTANLGLSDQTMGTVMINGKEITIPCKLSEARNDFELSTYRDEGLEAGLEASDSDVLHLLSDGNETGIRLMIRNFEDTDLADINDAYVVGVWVEDSEGTGLNAKFFKDITVGMGKEDLEKALDDGSYDKDQEEDYEYYTVKSDKNSELGFSITIKDGKVWEVDLDYYGK